MHIAQAQHSCLLRVSFHSSASHPHSISVGVSSRFIRGARHLLTSLNAWPTRRVVEVPSSASMWIWGL